MHRMTGMSSYASAKKWQLGRLLIVVAASAALGAGCSGDDDDDESPPEPDAAPRPACAMEVVASGLDKPFGILIDGEDFIVSADGVILAVTAAGESSVVATVSRESFAGLTRRGEDVIGMDNRVRNVIRFTPGTWQSTVIATEVGAGVSIETDGDDYILSDYNDAMNLDNNRLVRVKPDGSSQVIAGIGLGGPAGIMVDADGYIVSDYDGGRLLRVTREGEISVLLDGLGSPVEFKMYDGRYYIADYVRGSSSGRILEASADFSETRSLPVASLGSPSGLVIDGRDIYTTDLTGGRLLRLTNCLSE